MLNRRHLRIKVLQVLYAFFQSKDSEFGASQKELMRSVDRIYDLYLFLLLSFAEVRDRANYRLEENKKKIRPTDADLNPNRKFVDNKIIEILTNHSEIRRLSEDRKINWVGDENQEMFRKLFLQMREGETYFEFMNNEQEGFEEDRAFALAIFKSDIANSQLIYDIEHGHIPFDKEMKHVDKQAFKTGMKGYRSNKKKYKKRKRRAKRSQQARAVAKAKLKQ